MPVISSGYRKIIHGNTPEDVKQDNEGLQIMCTLARDMAWMLKLIKAGKSAGIPLPKQEETRIATKFIR